MYAIAKDLLMRAELAADLAGDPALAALLAAYQSDAQSDLLAQLCRADEAGHADIVARVVSACAVGEVAALPLAEMIRFRFGWESNVSGLVRRYLGTLHMFALRYLFPTRSATLPADALPTLRLLAQEIIEGGIERNSLFLYNLLLLTDLHNPDLTLSLCKRILKFELDGSATSETLLRIVRALTVPRSTAAIAMRDRPLRAAICVSGQLRGFQTAFPSWRHFGLEPANCDYFVHSWTEIGRKYPTPEHAERSFTGRFLEVFRREADLRGMAQLERLYPNFFDFFRKGSVASEVGIRDFYGAQRVVLEDQALPPYNDWGNSEKMHFKMWACHQMALDMGRDYDLYIRVRPDKILLEVGAVDWARFAWLSERDRVVFTNMRPTVFTGGSLGVSDEIAIGRRDVVTDFLSAWKELPEEWSAKSYSGFHDRFEGHQSLFLNGLLKGVRTIALNDTEQQPFIQFGKQIDPEPISTDQILGLLSIDVTQRERVETDTLFFDALDRDQP